MQMRIMRDVKIQEEVRREVLSFLEIDWLAGHQRSNEALQYQQQRLNTLPCLDVVLKSFGCDHSSKTTDLTSIKFLCTVITRVKFLFAVTMSNTLDQNTSTYVIISSESKWKIEWLNSTSWKRTINLQTFSQKHYQENVKNGDGRAVQQKFSSQSSTTTLSIENGSLFEGESECENLLHHTRCSTRTVIIDPQGIGDDLEEMDLKWQLALLCMRARRYYQRTGKKITINGSNTAGYDKSNVEYFNCHKMRHFARECRASKAMVAIDGAGFDRSHMADEEVPTNLALMAFSDSKLDNLRVEFNKSEFNLATYKRGLASVEEQLVFYKNNEIEKVKKEKESNQIKIDNFANASKSLDKLIGSQISNSNRKGVGYNAVPPPPTGLFAPPTINLSNFGLKEFQQPEFKGNGFKANKGVCENSSNEIKKTTDAQIIKDWVSDCDGDDSEVMVLKYDNVQHKPEQANQPKKVTVLTKSGIIPVSAARPINTAAPKSFMNAAKLDQMLFRINTAKINSVNTAKGNKVTSAVGEQGINTVKSSACWVWRPKIKIVTVDTVNDGEQKLTVTVDGQTITITEASVRRHLQLADADGISSFPNTEIFDRLTLMGYISNDDKLTFQKGTDISKITRKPSKTGKHGQKNGRVYESRKPKSTLSQSSVNPGSTELMEGRLARDEPPWTLLAYCK
ncbi:hypothetical protein Tco_0897997 [Tanacetum coccineum]